MANATEDTNQEVKLVKTYCKPADVNVEDLEFIRQQVHLCFIGKKVKRKIPKTIDFNRENHKSRTEAGNTGPKLQQNAGCH